MPKEILIGDEETSRDLKEVLKKLKEAEASIIEARANLYKIDTANATYLKIRQFLEMLTNNSDDNWLYQAISATERLNKMLKIRK